jgi:hypothetical protein
MSRLPDQVLHSEVLKHWNKHVFEDSLILLALHQIKEQYEQTIGFFSHLRVLKFNA